jgi:hypothetical protein
MGILVAIIIALTAGAAIDNQFPAVGEKITQSPQVCDKE